MLAPNKAHSAHGHSVLVHLWREYKSLKPRLNEQRVLSKTASTLQLREQYLLHTELRNPGHKQVRESLREFQCLGFNNPQGYRHWNDHCLVHRGQVV